MGMDGPQAISFMEIEAWSRCTGIRPPPFAIRLICQLDNIYHNALHERRKRESAAKKPKTVQDTW